MSKGKRLSTSKKGAHGELIACAWLIDQGYEVFRNVAPDGPADIVAWQPQNNIIHIIEARASYASFTRKDGVVNFAVKVSTFPNVKTFMIKSGVAFGFINADGDRIEP